MAKITLNKASRLQDSLRRKLTTLPLKAETTLSIFGADPAAEIARRAGTLSADIDRADRLLTILADVRASVGQANAESGIAALLAAGGGNIAHLRSGAGVSRWRHDCRASLVDAGTLRGGRRRRRHARYGPSRRDRSRDPSAGKSPPCSAGSRRSATGCASSMASRGFRSRTTLSNGSAASRLFEATDDGMVTFRARRLHLHRVAAGQPRGA